MFEIVVYVAVSLFHLFLSQTLKTEKKSVCLLLVHNDVQQRFPEQTKVKSPARPTKRRTYSLSPLKTGNSDDGTVATNLLGWAEDCST